MTLLGVADTMKCPLPLKGIGMSDCSHPNKQTYDAGDGKNHWVCPDCGKTDSD